MTKAKLALILLVLIHVSCDNNNISGNNHSKLPTIDSVTFKDALKIVSSFSRTFEPDSFAYEGIGTIENIPDSVLSAFKVLRQTDTLSHKKHLIVIFLKLYLDHLRCCHQSYELRGPFTLYIDSVTNPMLYEFNLFTGMFDIKKHHEFINSGIAHTFVKKHKDLLMYPERKEVMDKIKPVTDSIDKHIYWEN